MSWRMNFTREPAQRKIARILTLLSEQPRTVHALVETVPLSRRHVQEYLNHLMDAERIHIRRWVRDISQSGRMYPRPVYAAGKGRNAPQPPALTPKERQRRAWELVKADPERYVSHLLSKRRYRSDRRGARPDRAAAWIAPANDEMKEAA